MFVAVLVRTTPENELVADYAHQAERRFRNRDYEGAIVCYERLVKMQPTSDVYRFHLATCLEENKQEGRAEMFIRRLAPKDADGYAPAQLWVARRLMRRSQKSEQVVAQAEAHLLHARETKPNSSEASSLLGQIYATSGRLAEAEYHLKRAAPAEPELYNLLAAVCKLEGKASEVRTAADRAHAIFALRVKDHPENVSDRVNLALSDVILGHYESAVATLKEGIEGSNDPKKPLKPNPDPYYKSSLAKVYIGWFDALALDPDAAPSERIKALEEGLSYDPSSAELIDRLLRLIHAGGPDGQRAHESLRALAKSDRIPASIQFALGVDAWERKEFAEARDYFEQAHKLSPTHSTSANNLAWALSSEPPLDLPRALRLIDKAIEEQPRDARFHGTRGHILARLGRWQEALGELELALRARPESPDLHTDLAEVYEHLGVPDIAAEHRRFVATDGAKHQTPEQAKARADSPEKQ